MAFVEDRVSEIYTSLDQIATVTVANEGFNAEAVRRSSEPLLKLRELEGSTASIRLASPSTFSSNVEKLRGLLREAQTLQLSGSSDGVLHPRDNAALWQLVSKACAQTYGLVLNQLLHQTLSVEDEIWYWNDVLGSYRYTALYSIQTSPIRLYNWSREVISEVRQRRNVVAEGWQDFYKLVRTVVRERNLDDVQRRMMSPLALLRAQVKGKHAALERARSANASSIGYLLSNCFTNESLSVHEYDGIPSSKWRAATAHAIASIDAVLDVATDFSVPADTFESEVNGVVASDDFEGFIRPLLSEKASKSTATLHPSDACERLYQVLSQRLPSFVDSYNRTISENQRPSAVIRYWMPAAALLLSSSTILRIFVRRRAAILQWIRELGATAVDFWYNWVVEPTKKVIGTIRHDESSEVSLISKGSLEGDRASLERMVVDFAIDNPEGPALSDADVSLVRSKIQNGDLTAVLRAYERELKSPLYSSVRGNLIRALLIQIQKTKVDVEVAMGGIDALLKSQELVFGFVGLTPGILVCVGLWRYLGSLSSSRASSSRAQKQSKSYTILRNIDRILTGSPQVDMGVLSSKEYGLLVCEGVVLRDLARRTFPRSAYREFLRDFSDLIDRHSGVGRQIRVADRIRWAYAQWLR